MCIQLLYTSCTFLAFFTGSFSFQYDYYSSDKSSENVDCDYIESDLVNCSSATISNCTGILGISCAPGINQKLILACTLLIGQTHIQYHKCIIIYHSQAQAASMVILGSRMEMKLLDEWRFATITYGEQFVMMNGGGL